MAITKDKKVAILEKLNQALVGAAGVTFVNFHGLSVALATELRRQLRAAGANYLVAKKTLLRRALETTKTEGVIPELAGEVALAYGSDPVAAAKSVYSFQKKNAGFLKIIGGIFEKRFLDEGGMTTIASIPDRPVLYGQFVNLLNWPIQGLVVALDQIAAKKS